VHLVAVRVDANEPRRTTILQAQSPESNFRKRLSTKELQTLVYATHAGGTTARQDHRANSGSRNQGGLQGYPPI
jgi:hypothetical protein